MHGSAVPDWVRSNQARVVSCSRCAACQAVYQDPLPSCIMFAFLSPGAFCMCACLEAEMHMTEYLASRLDDVFLLKAVGILT